jgi:hypothetical protein
MYYTIVLEDRSPKWVSKAAIKVWAGLCSFWILSERIHWLAFSSM